MIIAVLRKDLELHWMAAIVIPVLYFALNLAAIRSPEQQVVDAMAIPLYIAGFYLLTALVQGDPIPSDQADWLIRPIPRLHLLGAKLAFVAIVFVVPIFLTDLLLPVFVGFGFNRAAGVAVGHLVSTTAGFILPTMAIAATTSSLAQCALGGVIAAFGYSLLLPFLPWSVERDPSVLVWIEDTGAVAIALVLSMAVLSLQYFGRKTRWSFVCCAFGIAAFAGLARIPLKHFWEFQARYRPASEVAEPVEIKVLEKQFYLSSAAPLLIHVPIEIKRGNPEALLIPQRALMRVRFANGEVREAETRDLRNANFDAGRQYFSFDFGIEPDLYDLRRIPATAEFQFYFLGFEPFQSRDFLRDDEAQFVPGAGYCRTHRSKDSIIGECLKIGDDSPVGFAPTPRDLKWYELSLDRLAPFFIRFRPTVFSWTERLAEKAKLEVDLGNTEKNRKQFQAYDLPVRVNTSALNGVVVRIVRTPETHFWELPFRPVN